MVERIRPRDDGDRGRDEGRRSSRDEPRARGGSGGGGSKWRYEPQRTEDIHQRANRTGGRFDSIFKSGFDTWRPKAGDNVIRFLPGTWGLGVHYAYDVWTHRYVGADDSTYLCADKMLGKYCPICEAAAEAKRAKDDDEAKALRAVEQRVSWILDRDGDNKTVPTLFVMSWTMDRDILSLTEDKRRKEQLWIDNPAEGYDVTIKRSGTGLNTRYFGIAIDRSPSPIADKPRDVDKIMDYIGENPIPDILNYYDADYIEKVLSGTSGPRDDEPVRGREREGERDRDRDEPRERDRDRRDEPEPDDRPRARVGREPEPEPERSRRDRDEPEPRRGRDRDEPEPRRGRDRDEPEPEREEPRSRRTAARDEGRDERDDDRDGRDRREPDDAPRARGGRDRDEPDDRRSARGNGRDRDDDEPPFDGGRRTRGSDDDADSRPRRASRDEEPEPRGGRDRRGGGGDDEEDRRPARRR